MSEALTVIEAADSCDDCGACCRHVGTPPGFFGAYCFDDRPAGYLEESEDWPIWLAMPDALKAELRAYYDALRAGGIDRAEAELPCLWYDAATARCRHHDHRPGICRDFTPGSSSCVGHRERLGVAGPHPVPPPDFEDDWG